MSEDTSQLPRMRRLPRGLVFLLIAAVIVAWLAIESNQSEESPAPPQWRSAASETVELRVELGGGRVREWPQIPWHEGQTVQQAMQQATRCKPSLQFETVGSGEAAFVTRIEGRSNEGVVRGARNWIYYIGPEKAKASFAVQEISAGDRIVWRFERFDESSSEGKGP